MSDPNPLGSRHSLPFMEITVRALRYVCKRLGLALTPTVEGALMGQYAHLTAFPDAAEVLRTVKGKGIATAILSNGDHAVLADLAARAGLAGWLDEIVTVEAVKLFKTAPETYALLEKTFPVRREEILFVSSNAWDALGAGWFGLDVLWVNRLGHPFEEIGPVPTYTGTALGDVLGVVERAFTRPS